jgi:hypothetical protein
VNAHADRGARAYSRVMEMWEPDSSRKTRCVGSMR